MRFFMAKSEHQCHYCKLAILKGSPFVRLVVTNGEIRLGLLFHPDCFPTWEVLKFRERFSNWYQSHKPAEKRGRPKKYTDSKAANRINSLRLYRQKKGEATTHLEERLKALEIVNPE